MRMSVDLAAAWNRLIASGTIRNTFEDAAGRRIEAGVRLGPRGPESYAIAVETGCSVCAPAQRTRLANGMEILFNPVGGLKPHTRPAGPGRQPDLSADAAGCPLHCQEPEHALSVLRRPSLVEISCAHRRWLALPNVAPWEPRGILLWVPADAHSTARTLPHLPQRLTPAALEDYLELAKASEGIATFFNGLHGGASANHLHFQSVYCDRKFAVESAARIDRGPYALLDDYPASGVVFPREVDCAQLWEMVDRIQTAGYPLNLIALPGGIFLFVRNPEHEILAEFPGRAFGAINFAGLFITSDAEELRHVTEESIAEAYAKMTIGGALLRDLLGDG